MRAGGIIKGGKKEGKAAEIRQWCVIKIRSKNQSCGEGGLHTNLSCGSFTVYLFRLL